MLGTGVPLCPRMRRFLQQTGGGGIPAQARADNFVSADARLPPPIAEASSASLRSPFAEAQAPPTACPRVRFAGPSTSGPVEEEDDNGVSVTSNPHGRG